MIFPTAYDTSVCKQFLLKEVKDGITKAIIVNDLKIEEHGSIRQDLAFDYYLVEGGNTSSDNIKYFNHPMLMTTLAVDNKFVLDVRNYGRFHKPTGEFIITQKPGYTFDVNRLILNQMWIKERPEMLRDISNLPAMVYSSLFSDCIGKRFALNPKEQMDIAIIVSYFYYGLFTNDEFLTDAELDRAIEYVSRVSRFKHQEVKETIETMLGSNEKHFIIKDLESLCQVIKDVTGSPALKDLNIGVLLTLLTSTWYGNNSKEVLAAGLEHIPTWITIIYTSIEDKSFSRTGIAKISERFKRNSDDFIKVFNTIVEGKKPF